MSFLYRLSEGFIRHEMPHRISETTEGLPTIIRFEKADDDDCSLTIMVHSDKLEVHRVIGKHIISQPFTFHCVDDHFFEIIKDHYETIKSLIEMRKKFLALR